MSLEEKFAIIQKKEQARALGAHALGELAPSPEKPDTPAPVAREAFLESRNIELERQLIEMKAKLDEKDKVLKGAVDLAQEYQGQIITLRETARRAESVEETPEEREQHRRNIEKFNQNDDVEGLLGYLDVREQNIARKAAQEAYKDPLTGIMNRRGLEAAVEGIFSELETKYQREQLPVAERRDRESAPRYEGMSFFLIDLDYFKKLNDTEGHLAGDEALKAIAISLKSHLRKNDFVGRWGGEEFVVVITSVNPIARLAVAEKIRKSIASAVIEHKGKKISVTASIGVATWRPGVQQSDLFQEADDALYHAKETGRNRFVDAEDLATERRIREDASKTLAPQ